VGAELVWAVTAGVDSLDRRNKIALTCRLLRGLCARGAFQVVFRKGIPLSGVLPVDKIDRKILALLQKDATIPVAEVGRKVGLSTTPCWRRIQKMEEDGVIRGRVAVLDPVKINAGVTVFVSVKTNEHNEAWMRKFAAVVDEFTEVVEFYRMSGDVCAWWCRISALTTRFTKS
jgi:DNA-binding Lrp family transcriptional regulator